MPDGPTFFDMPAVFDTYATHRRSPDNPNDLIEEPAVMEVLGSVKCLRILDLGCGDGTLGKLVLDRDASAYVGVDGSKRMIADARQTLICYPAAKLIHGRVEDDALWRGPFDLVVSRLTLHYVQDLQTLLKAVRTCLSVNRRLIVTVEHPVLTSFEAPRNQDGRRGSWIVDNYFDEGPRQVSWMGDTVIKYHRTVGTYVAFLQATGFKLTALREPGPDRKYFAGRSAEYQRRSRIPMFLLLAGRAVGRYAGTGGT